MTYKQLHIFYLLLVLNTYRIVPLNKIGSWRMIDSLDLNVCKGSLAISIPSMIILPIQKKADSVYCATQLLAKTWLTSRLEGSTAGTGLVSHTPFFTKETCFD